MDDLAARDEVRRRQLSVTGTTLGVLASAHLAGSF
jgi:predicted nucleic acid-binding protein